VGSIAIVGLEQDAAGALDGTIVERLRAADAVVVPAADGSAAAVLSELGIVPVIFTELGIDERSPAEEVVEALLGFSRDRDVILAAFGYPFLREGVISGILSRTRSGVDVFPVVSPLQVLIMALELDLTADLAIVDAGSLPNLELRRDTHLIVTGIENAIVARAVADRLRGYYPPEHSVVTSGCLEAGGFDLTLSTLEQLGRVDQVCRDTALYISPSRIEPPGGFDEFVRLIAVLRGPDGCPWDREQTHATLGKHLIEESYETLAAIEAGDDAALAEELGDVLLQIVLHAQIGAEDGTFTIDDVVASIITKIRRRHPHIFGTVTAETSAEVIHNWDAIKREEKPAGGVLGDVPHTLPSLMLAQKISRRAASAGFDWEDLGGVWAKVHEEIDELKAADPGSPEAADEVGDLLFTVVNVARKMGIDAESALRGTCAKFVRRFGDMESANAGSRALDELDLAEWEDLWRQAKAKESAAPGGSDE
jgi:tetrapyrrole methylase family protein/MazG family protein